MTEVKGPAPSILDKVKEPSREESETRRKDFEQHVAAQPGFATAASTLARETFPGGRADVDAGELNVPDTAPRVRTEPGVGPARDELPKIIVPAPPAPELDERLRATTPPVPKGVRSTARYDAVELAPSPAAIPDPRTRKIVLIAAVCLLLVSALAYFATRPEEVVPAPASSSGTAATSSTPVKSTAPVTAIAPATMETSAPPVPSTGTTSTSSAPDRSATSKRSASAKASAHPTQDATATATTATVKTVPSPTTSSPPTSTVPWIKPKNQ